MYNIEYSAASLHDLMKSRKVTGKRLAKESGLSQRYVSLLKKGKATDPSLSVVRKLGNVLGVTFI